MSLELERMLRSEFQAIEKLSPLELILKAKREGRADQLLILSALRGDLQNLFAEIIREYDLDIPEEMRPPLKYLLSLEMDELSDELKEILAQRGLELEGELPLSSDELSLLSALLENLLSSYRERNRRLTEEISFLTEPLRRELQERESRIEELYRKLKELEEKAREIEQAERQALDEERFESAEEVEKAEGELEEPSVSDANASDMSPHDVRSAETLEPEVESSSVMPEPELQGESSNLNPSEELSPDIDLTAPEQKAERESEAVGERLESPAETAEDVSSSETESELKAYDGESAEPTSESLGVSSSEAEHSALTVDLDVDLSEAPQVESLPSELLPAFSGSQVQQEEGVVESLPESSEPEIEPTSDVVPPPQEMTEVEESASHEETIRPDVSLETPVSEDLEASEGVGSEQSVEVSSEVERGAISVSEPLAALSDIEEIMANVDEGLSLGTEGEATSAGTVVPEVAGEPGSEGAPQVETLRDSHEQDRSIGEDLEELTERQLGGETSETPQEIQEREALLQETLESIESTLASPPEEFPLESPKSQVLPPEGISLPLDIPESSLSAVEMTPQEPSSLSDWGFLLSSDSYQIPELGADLTSMPSQLPLESSSSSEQPVEVTPEPAQPQGNVSEGLEAERSEGGVAAEGAEPTVEREAEDRLPLVEIPSDVDGGISEGSEILSTLSDIDETIATIDESVSLLPEESEPDVQEVSQREPEEEHAPEDRQASEETVRESEGLEEVNEVISEDRVSVEDVKGSEEAEVEELPPIEVPDTASQILEPLSDMEEPVSVIDEGISLPLKDESTSLMTGSFSAQEKASLPGSTLPSAESAEDSEVPGLTREEAEEPLSESTSQREEEKQESLEGEVKPELVEQPVGNEISTPPIDLPLPVELPDEDSVNIDIPLDFGLDLGGVSDVPIVTVDSINLDLHLDLSPERREALEEATPSLTEESAPSPVGATDVSAEDSQSIVESTVIEITSGGPREELLKQIHSAIGKARQVFIIGLDEASSYGELVIKEVSRALIEQLGDISVKELVIEYGKSVLMLVALREGLYMGILAQPGVASALLKLKLSKVMKGKVLSSIK